jgi:hypothetical protein
MFRYATCTTHLVSRYYSVGENSVSFKEELEATQVLLLKVQYVWQAEQPARKDDSCFLLKYVVGQKNEIQLGLEEYLKNLLNWS